VNQRHLLRWIVAVLIVIMALLFAFWADQFVCDWVTQHPNRTAITFMHYVSRVGDWPGHVAVGLVLVGVAWWRKSEKWKRVFLAMLVACAVAGATARFIKITTGRARPSVKTEEVWAGPHLSSKYHAFPSGHTASSTAFFAVLLFASWRIGLPCMAIPALIAFSRMYVAAHYFSDVVAAAILGLLCALIVSRLMRLEPIVS